MATLWSPAAGSLLGIHILRCLAKEKCGERAPSLQFSLLKIVARSPFLCWEGRTWAGCQYCINCRHSRPACRSYFPRQPGRLPHARPSLFEGFDVTSDGLDVLSAELRECLHLRFVAYRDAFLDSFCNFSIRKFGLHLRIG